MKLPWRATQRASIVVPEAEPEPSRPAVTTYKSPGLEAAVRRLPGRDECRILDLGPAVEDNLSYLGELARWVQIVDLGRHRPGDKTSIAAAVERDISLLRGLLPSMEASFHLVMVWDVLDYVSRQRIEDLASLLAQLCAPEARIFTTVFESKTMSAVPDRHRILREFRVVAEAQTSDQVVAPEMPPAAVERALRGFRIEHSFVLRHGAREYVAAKKAAPEG